MNFSIPHFHRFLSDFFVAVGFAILIFFLPGAIGILLSFIFLAIATFIIYSNLKYSTRISYYDPLLLSVAMVAAMGSILFVEHLPTKAYPIIGCLLLSPMINMCAWAIDKRYKEQSFKQLMKENFRLPPSVDIVIIIGLFTYFSPLWPQIDWYIYAIFILVLIDLLRQIDDVQQHKVDFF